jgi:RNA polymerase sigma factor (sigma-70 family)
MLHHDKLFVGATQEDLRAASARRRPLVDPGELERFLLASDPRGQVKPSALRRLTTQIRAIARAHRVPAHDVDDVVQTTWLRLVEHGDSIREPRALGAWLQTTARRESLRTLRRAARTLPIDPTEIVEQRDRAPDLESCVVAAEHADALSRAIAELPERQRRLMRMLIAEPAPSYAEVSRALDMPIGSIGPTRERALARLRRNPRLSSLAWQE